MNFIFIRHSEVVNDQISLSASRAKEIKARHPGLVLGQIYPGVLERKGRATLLLSELENGTWHGTYSALQSEVICPNLVLLVAMCRPPTVRKIISCAGQVGVSAIWFVKADATVPGYEGSSVYREEEIAAEQILAAEQSGVSHLVQIETSLSLRHLLQSDFLTTPYEKVLFDKGGARGVSLPIGKPCLLAFGPEAGWSPAELTMFQQVGFRSFCLGEQMFRIESAVALALGKFL